MKTTLIDGALILALCEGIPNLTAYSESDNKSHLRPTEELALPEDSQLHIAELPDGPRLRWLIVAHYSGIQFFPQPKSDCYEVPNHSPDGLLVSVNIFTSELSKLALT
jgi:hypothetical protein